MTMRSGAGLEDEQLRDRRGRAARLVLRRCLAIALSRRNAHARRCQFGPAHMKCGALLEDRIDRQRGIVVRWCPQCDRRERGICRDCPAPVAGQVRKAIYCAACRDRHQRASIRRYTAAHLADVRAKARNYYANDPERRDLRNAYKRAYRKLHRDKTVRQKYRAGIRHNAAREKMLAYHRRYNAERRAAKALAAKLAYRESHPLPQPICRDCRRDIPFHVHGERISLDHGTAGMRPPSRCIFCAVRRNKHEVRASVARWIRRADGEIAAGRPPKPKRVRPWTPRQRSTRHNAAGERLCWTETCVTVVRGREKKCAACKAREAAAAAHLLVAHTGRGRRTDLATVSRIQRTGARITRKAS